MKITGNDEIAKYINETAVTRTKEPAQKEGIQLSTFPRGQKRFRRLRRQ
jgi:hypothetical protein